ncbi:CsbD family protein [Blastococcus sp. SYSU DS0552]
MDKGKDNFEELSGQGKQVVGRTTDGKDLQAGEGRPVRRQPQIGREKIEDVVK